MIMSKEQPEIVGKPTSLSSQTQKQALRKTVTLTVGTASIVIGLFLLTLTNPEGNNWASILSPLMIIGGYVVVIVGLLLKP
jgi:hypothetical protein